MKTTKSKQSTKAPVRQSKPRERMPAPSTDVVPLVETPLPVRTPVDRHKARMHNWRSKRPPVDDANKQRLVEMVRTGELPADVCDDKSMPPLSAFLRAMQTDETFADDYAEAVATMADMALQDAQAFARECAATGSIDQTRIADIYMRSTIAMIEKLSPRTHGALVKHAGADAGPVQVAVINYATQAKQ